MRGVKKIKVMNTHIKINYICQPTIYIIQNRDCFTKINKKNEKNYNLKKIFFFGLPDTSTNSHIFTPGAKSSSQKILSLLVNTYT